MAAAVGSDPKRRLSCQGTSEKPAVSGMIRQTGTPPAREFLLTKQPAFPGLRDAMKKKVTRREQFLTEMDSAFP